MDQVAAPGARQVAGEQHLRHGAKRLLHLPPDGRDNWIIYHADTSPDQKCTANRSPRIQPFGWTADGRPDFPVPVGEATRLAAPSGDGSAPSKRFLLTWHTPNLPGSKEDPERYWASQKTLYVTSRDLRAFADRPRGLFEWEMATIEIAA